MKKHLKVLLLILSVTFLQNTSLYSNEQTVEPGISYDEIYDPIEPINRAVLKSLKIVKFSKINFLFLLNVKF